MGTTKARPCPQRAAAPVCHPCYLGPLLGQAYFPVENNLVPVPTCPPLLQPVASASFTGLPPTSLTWPPWGIAAATVHMSAVEDSEHLPCFSPHHLLLCPPFPEPPQSQTMALPPYFST